MIYLDLLLGFLRVGCFAFGGAYGAIPLIRDVVLSYGWMDDDALAYMIAVSESTPGPIMVNLATYVGSSQAGLPGAILATLAVVLPSFIVILLITASLKNLLKHRLVQAALRGVITQTENEQRSGIRKRVVEADEVRPVKKGDRVRLLNVGGVLADVLAPADKNGNVQVQAGPMKMTVKENELRIVEETKPAKKQHVQPRRDAPRRALNIRAAESEVDVRGMSAEEALFEVDNFLSRAIMAGLPSVTVIHGKGTGVLREAVQKHLRANKRVKSVRSGVYGEGEQGVTIVELR